MLGKILTFGIIVTMFNPFVMAKKNNTLNIDVPPKTANNQLKKNVKKKPSLIDKNFELLKQELDNKTKKTTKQQQIKTNWAWQFLKTTFVLAILIIVFWGGYKLIQFRKSLPQSRSQVIRPLHSTPLQPGKVLQLIEFNSKILLLSVSDAGIQLVSEVTERSAIDQIKLDCEKEAGIIKPDFLVELTKRIKDKFDPAAKNKSFNTTYEDTQKEWEVLRKSSKSKIKNLKDNRKDLKQRTQNDDDLFS